MTGGAWLADDRWVVVIEVSGREGRRGVAIRTIVRC